MSTDHRLAPSSPAPTGAAPVPAQGPTAAPAGPRPPLAAIWAQQTRAPFLLLSVLLVAIGGAAASRVGPVDWLRLAACALGVVLAHAAVNLFNEHSDHRTGIDARTRRTPFSGGSGMLQAGLTSPAAVRVAAWSTLLAAGALGLWLSLPVGWPLWLIMAIGGLSAIFYTSHLARWMLGELAAGLSLGSLVVIGSYWVLAGPPDAAVLWVSLPPGILTALLLYLNEFPDAEADRAGGRRHLVIVLGPRGAAYLYTAALATSYLITITAVALAVLPGWVLLSLLTLPLAVRAATGALRDHAAPERLVGAQAANVMTVLGTDLLLALGLLLA